MKKSPKKPITKRIWFWPVTAFAALTVVAGITGQVDERYSVESEPPVIVEPVESQTPNGNDPETNESDTPVPETPDVPEENQPESSGEQETTPAQISQAPEETISPTPTPAQTPTPASTPSPSQTPTPSPEPSPEPEPSPVVSQEPPPTPPPVQLPEPSPLPPEEPEQQPEPSAPVLQGVAGFNPETSERMTWPSGQFLASAQSDKYHRGNCRGAKAILPENEIWFSSEDEAQAAGYSRCGLCW